MPWPNLILLAIFSLTLTCCSNLCEARHRHHKGPSAVVVGTVYCDTCFQDDLSKGGHYIPGATVAVECEEGKSRPAFYQEVKTDEKGTFRVSLPFSVSKHVREIQGCNVKLIKSSEPYCAVASTASSSAIHLKQRRRNTHIYSAGFFTFKPLKQPGLCNQQPSVTNSKLNSPQNLLDDVVIPTIPTLTPQIPNLPGLPVMPPLPNLPPLPSLPSLPPIPGLPGLPMPTIPKIPIGSSEEKKVDENGQVSQPQFFFPPIISPPSTGILPPNPLMPPPLVPNPFQPPPAPLIPNPFQPPSPPPSLIPPIPQLPPLPTLPPVPAVPGLTPTPTPSPPPAAPSFPIPLPPLIPIIPGIPGIPGIPIPPVSANAKKKLNP